MLKKTAIILLSLLVLVACNRDERERLFEMVYPNIRFTIPAGLPGGFVQRALVLDRQDTRYEAFLRENGVSNEMVSAISPALGRLTALDGFDLDFISAISVRMCAEGSASCGVGDEVFYLEYEDIRRQGGNLRLQPSLINAKRILSQERYKLEVVFNFLYTTPASVDVQLDMSFDAVN